MASQNKLKIFNKGWNTDFNPVSQPEGTYRDAFNKIQSSQEGDIYSIINEKGTKEIVNFPVGCQVIGHVVLDDDIIFFLVNKDQKSSNIVEFRVVDTDDGFFHGVTDIIPITLTPSGIITDPAVLNQGQGKPGTATTDEEFRDQIVDRINTATVFQPFGLVATPISTDRIRVYSKTETAITVDVTLQSHFADVKSLTGFTGFSKIGIVDKNDVYTSIVDTPELGFSLSNQIEAKARIRFDGHRVIYFTDNLNPPRTVDLDDPPVNNFNEITSLVFKFGVPIIEFDSIEETGGDVPVGSNQFIARYLTSSLDKTSFGFSSQIIPIVDEIRSVGRNDFDGAPIDTATNKLINFKVSNVDITGNFQFIEVAVIRYPGTDDDLALPTIEVFDRQEISGAVMDFQYKGPQSTDIPVDLSEVVIQSTNYSRTKCIEQKDDRLYLSNLSADVDIDFQKIANDVVVDYFVEEVSAVGGQSIEFDDYKGEKQTFDKKGYKREEVYSVAIGFLLTNGSSTNGFHIPGKDLGTNNPGRNLSLTTSTGVGDTSGPLGTFISTKKYPSGQGYPETSGVRDNIRHHIMPTLNQEPHFRQGSAVTLRVLGLDLSNIIIPPEFAGQIQGYFIVREKRDKKGNRSILAQGLAQTFVKLTGNTYSGLGKDVTVFNKNKGYFTNGFLLGHTRLRTGGRVFIKGGRPTGGQGVSDINGNDNAKNLVSFFSPENIFRAKGESVSRLLTEDFSAIKPVLGLRGSIVTRRNIKNTYNEKRTIGFDRGFHGIQHVSTKYTTHFDVSADEQQITKATYIDGISSEGSGIPFSTLGFDKTPFTGTEIFSPYDNPGFLALFLGTINLNQPTQIESDLFLDHTLDNSLVPNVINNDSTTHPHLGGTSERFLYNLVNLIGDQYGDITDAEYVFVNNSFDIFQDTIKCFNGDTFISLFSYKNSNMIQLESNPFGNKNKAHNLKTNRDFGNNGYEMRALAEYWVESNINTNYRHIVANGVPYFPKLPIISAGQNSVTGLSGERDHVQAQPNSSFPDNQGVLDVDPVNGESRFYNFLYSKEDKVRVFDPKPLAFKEVGKFPNRTIFSDLALPGEQKDNYRIFKPNSLKDSPKNTGPINDTFVWSDILYLHTSKSLWRTYINETALLQTVTGETMQVGQGGLFDRPEKEILTLDGGYAGSQSQWGGINTPYGRFFVDLNQKKIFQFTGKLKEISSEGQWKFLLRNMGIEDSDVDDPDFKDNPANPANGGYVAGFDYKNKRLLITKNVKAPPRAGFAKEQIIELIRDRSFLLDLPDNQPNQGIDSVINTDLFTIKAEAGSTPSFLVFTFIRLPEETNLVVGFTIFICNEFDDGNQNVQTDVIRFDKSLIGSSKVFLNFGECGKFVLNSDKTSWTFSLIDKKDIVFEETIDRRFNISYSPVTQSWIGRHGWFPSDMVSRGDRFFSANNTKSIGNESLWEHGEGVYGGYYLLPVQKSELLLVMNIDPAITKTLDNLILHTQAFDETNLIFDLNETFDELQVFNEYQNTGAIVLTVGFDTNVRFREDKFRISVPGDTVKDIANSIFAPANLDPTIKFKARIRSKYMFIKLSYSNPKNLRLVLNAIEVIFKTSVS